MARCLAVYGFLPWLGLHHDNELNQFNLADDLMEPFRSAADLYAAANVAEDAALTPGLKGSLVNLLNVDILSGGQHHSVAYAMERLVQRKRRREKARGTSAGFPAAERLYTPACRYGKAIPVHSNSFGKLSAGGRSLCL